MIMTERRAITIFWALTARIQILGDTPGLLNANLYLARAQELLEQWRLAGATVSTVAIVSPDGLTYVQFNFAVQGLMSPSVAAAWYGDLTDVALEAVKQIEQEVG